MEIAQAKAFMEQGKNHKAFQLCKKCAEGKHGTANPVLTCTTAKMYQYGIGTVKNFAKAEHLARRLSLFCTCFLLTFTFQMEA